MTDYLWFLLISPRFLIFRLILHLTFDIFCAGELRIPGFSLQYKTHGAVTIFSLTFLSL